MVLRPTKLGSSKWKIKFVNGDAKYKPGDQFLWPGNENCLVLVGYTKTDYIFNDPLAGVVESRYKEQGNKAIVVIKKSSQKVEYPKQFKMTVIYPQPMTLFPEVEANSNDKKLTQEQQWAKGMNGAIKVILSGAAVAIGTGGLSAAVGGAALILINQK